MLEILAFPSIRAANSSHSCGDGEFCIFSFLCVLLLLILLLFCVYGHMSYDLRLIPEVSIFPETKLGHEVLYFSARNRLGDFYILKHGKLGEISVVEDNE